MEVCLTTATVLNIDGKNSENLKFNNQIRHHLSVLTNLLIY